MRSAHRYIIYIVVLLILVLGALLFAFRNQAVGFLNDKTGLPEAELNTNIATSSLKNVLDTTVLETPKFESLKNNVKKFDFDSICGEPVGRVETTATSTEGESVTTSAVLSCVLGNGLPFAVPPKK